MIDTTKKSFEDAIDALLQADPRNSSKGKVLKEWFSKSFNFNATVSHIKEDKQIGNRVSEQFKHKAPIVVFVCASDVNTKTLKTRIEEQAYKGLNTILIMSDTKPYQYEELFTVKGNPFTEWAEMSLKTIPQHGYWATINSVSIATTTNLMPYFSALRTKPFMLLAGMSGTGKSRIVREFAFDSCPEELQDADGTAPGNYCMIEVKPNWHDSTELLGYWSNLNKQYMFTKFVKFLIKAKMYPETPFFVCLDEMNLAPVEQYFAEFLSVLETRKHIENEEGEVCIKSGVLVDKEYFKKVGEVGNNSLGHAYPTCPTDRDIYMKLFDIVDKAEMEKVPANDAKTLTEVGLTLPENVFIVGTVNMDDTTHQFSRKVIDRAMTIEMNGGNLADIFSDKDELVYAEQPLTMDNLQAKYVSAKEVLTLCSTVKDNEDMRNYIIGNGEEGLPQRLEEINKVLNGTPFTVSYRVMNELTIYLAVLLDQAEEKGEEVTLDSFKGYVEIAIDKILLMKILPRVEGDDEMFHISDKERNANELSDQAEDGHEFTKLDWLKQIAPQHNEDNQNEYMAVDKLAEMIERLNRQSFTRFWP